MRQLKKVSNLRKSFVRRLDNQSAKLTKVFKYSYELSGYFMFEPVYKTRFNG